MRVSSVMDASVSDLPASPASTEPRGAQGATPDGPADPPDPNEVCRICMLSGVLISLFDNEEALGMCEKVSSCAAVRIGRDDGLPEGICKRCAADLEVAFDFKTRCERSDAALREKLGLKTKTIVKTEFVLIDCDDEEEERVGRRVRSKKPLDDDFVHDGDFSGQDSDYPPFEEYKKKKTRRKRKRPCDGKSSRDSDDSTPLSRIPPKKRKTAATSGGKYPCLQCGKSFPYPSVLKLHSVTHAKEKTHKCIMCSETFPHSRNLYAHYKEAHPYDSAASKQDGPESYPCTQCDKVFTQGKNLKVHEAMHAREKKYKCDGCSMGFTNMSILQIHKKQEHPDMFRLLSCNHCNRNFRKQSSLERHMENHKRSRETGAAVEAKKPPLMKDLFKSIAPLTTTYWSDSFSD